MGKNTDRLVLFTHCDMPSCTLLVHDLGCPVGSVIEERKRRAVIIPTKAWFPLVRVFHWDHCLTRTEPCTGRDRRPVEITPTIGLSQPNPVRIRDNRQRAVGNNLEKRVGGLEIDRRIIPSTISSPVILEVISSRSPRGVKSTYLLCPVAEARI